MTRKRFLFVFSQAPHQGLSAKEGFDFALACAAFDQHVDMFFTANGIYHLLKGQDCTALKSKNHSASIAAFELYGIETCYYNNKSLLESGLTLEDLMDIKAQPGDVQTLMPDYDFILTY